MADEKNTKPKVPEEEFEAEPVLRSLDELVKYELQVPGQTKPVTVYADPVIKDIVAYATRVKSKDPNAPPTEGAIYVFTDESHFVSKGSKESQPLTEEQHSLCLEKVGLYTPILNKLLAAETAANKIPADLKGDLLDEIDDKQPGETGTIDDKVARPKVQKILRKKAESANAPEPQPVALPGEPAYVSVRDDPKMGYMIKAELPGGTFITYQLEGFFSTKAVGTDGKPISVPKEYMGALKQFWADHKKDYLALKGITG